MTEPYIVQEDYQGGTLVWVPHPATAQAPVTNTTLSAPASNESANETASDTPPEGTTFAPPNIPGPTPLETDAQGGTITEAKSTTPSPSPSAGEVVETDEQGGTVSLA